MANGQISPTMFDAPVVPTSDNPSVSVDMFDDIVGNIDKTEEQAEVETGEWLEQDNFNTAMAFMQGVSLGWYDEYRVGITSLAESALGEETYDQAYARNRAEYDAQAESFQKRQPVAAIGAEIAGAVVSPAAKVGAGIKGARGLVGLTTRGATEGAIYGAGKAKDVDSMAKEAGTGALFGLGSGALIGAGGWLLKKKIAAPLEKDGVFTPITLAAKKDDASESLFQSFYRDVVGPSLGGKGVIRAQEEKVVAPLVLKQAEREKALKDFVRASKAEGAEATAQLRNAVDNVTEAGKVKGVDVAGQAEIAEEIVKGKYDKFLGSKGEIIARKTQQLKNTVESNNDMLRLAAFDNSVPVGAKKADVAKILEAGDPNIAMNQLERLWQKEGFRSIKDISFRMKPEELLGQIEKRVTADTTLSLLAGKAGVRNLIEDGLVTLAAKRNPKTGRISGEDLSAVRNSFGMAASKMSDEGGQAALMQGLYREIQNVIDDNMKKQLSGKRLAAFEGDVASWASQTVLRDAVTRASTKAGRQGRFTADEWIASIKKNSPQQARRGKGPLRAEAEQLAALTAKQEGDIISSADKLANKLTARRANELKKVKNKAVAERNTIAKETATLKKNLRNNPANAERLAQNMKREDELRDTIEAGKKEIDAISKARTIENPTWYQLLASSAIIGSISGLSTGLTGGLTSAAGVVGTSRALATPTAQKIIAGQTATQEAVRQGLQKPLVGGMSAVDAITSFPRVGAGMLTGEQ
jgi:hypothetical protein